MIIKRVSRLWDAWIVFKFSHFEFCSCLKTFTNGCVSLPLELSFWRSFIVHICISGHVVYQWWKRIILSLFLYKNYWSFCFRESFPETELVTLIWLCLQRILERKRDLRRMQNLKVNFSVVSLGLAFITQFCIPRNWFIQ